MQDSTYGFHYHQNYQYIPQTTNEMQSLEVVAPMYDTNTPYNVGTMQSMSYQRFQLPNAAQPMHVFRPANVQTARPVQLMQLLQQPSIIPRQHVLQSSQVAANQASKTGTQQLPPASTNQAHTRRPTVQQSLPASNNQASGQHVQTQQPALNNQARETNVQQHHGKRTAQDRYLYERYFKTPPTYEQHTQHNLVQQQYVDPTINSYYMQDFRSSCEQHIYTPHTHQATYCHDHHALQSTQASYQSQVVQSQFSVKPADVYQSQVQASNAGQACVQPLLVKPTVVEHVKEAQNSGSLSPGAQMKPKRGRPRKVREQTHGKQLPASVQQALPQKMQSDLQYNTSMTSSVSNDAKKTKRFKSSSINQYTTCTNGVISPLMAPILGSASPCAPQGTTVPSITKPNDQTVVPKSFISDEDWEIIEEFIVEDLERDSIKKAKLSSASYKDSTTSSMAHHHTSELSFYKSANTPQKSVTISTDKNYDIDTSQRLTNFIKSYDIGTDDFVPLPNLADDKSVFKHPGDYQSVTNPQSSRQHTSLPAIQQVGTPQSSASYQTYQTQEMSDQVVAKKYSDLTWNGISNNHNGASPSNPSTPVKEESCSPSSTKAYVQNVDYYTYDEMELMMDTASYETISDNCGEGNEFTCSENRSMEEELYVF